MGLYLGNDFNNTLTGKGDDDSIFSFGGNDVLNGAGGNDTLLGGSGDDHLTGGVGADKLLGGSGTDTISYAGEVGNIIIYLTWNGKSGGAFGGSAAGDFFDDIENVIGGAGNDNLYGDELANLLTGGEGEDYLAGGAGNDQMFGGDDGDTMQGGLGADHHDGGAATDVIDYHLSDAAVSIDLAFFTASGGFAEGDTIQHVEELVGSAYADAISGNHVENSFHGLAANDTLTGRGGDDGLWGGDGNDILEGGLDRDYLDGGAGNDTASYRHASKGVAVALEGVQIRIGEAVGDQLHSIERLMGSDFSDILGGSSGTNRLTGWAGDDFLYAGDGDDDLLGGQGADVLAGGLGSDNFQGNGGGDIFYYGAATEGGDTVEDFGKGDTFNFRSSDFGHLEIGQLDNSLFVANASGKAQTADQRFTYELDTGVLRYDDNGSDAGGATIIATLTGAPVVQASHILIVDELTPF